MTRTAAAKTTKHLKAVDTAPDGDAGDTGEAPVDLGALETALTEFASIERPAILRADLARQKAAQAAREIESEIGDLDAREALLDRAYEAAKGAMAAQRDDLTQALAIYQHGLIGASTGRGVGEDR